MGSKVFTRCGISLVAISSSVPDVNAVPSLGLVLPFPASHQRPGPPCTSRSQVPELEVKIHFQKTLALETTC